MLLRRVNGQNWAQPFGGINRLFDQVMQDFPFARSGECNCAQFPPLNIWDDADNIYIEAELPGVTMESIDLTVTGDELTLKGERTFKYAEGTTFHRRERSEGSFARTIHLPVNIDAEDVSAKFTDGVLQVTLPKAAEAKPRKIEVKALGK